MITQCHSKFCTQPCRLKSSSSSSSVFPWHKPCIPPTSLPSPFSPTTQPFLPQAAGLLQHAVPSCHHCLVRREERESLPTSHATTTFHASLGMKAQSTFPLLAVKLPTQGGFISCGPGPKQMLSKGLRISTLMLRRESESWMLRAFPMMAVTFCPPYFYNNIFLPVESFVSFFFFFLFCKMEYIWSA